MQWRKYCIRAVLTAAGLSGVTALAQGDARPAAKQAPPGGRFEFTLKRDSLTSAGVYDAAGRLVCPLWALQSLDAGKHSGTWHGVDQFGQAVRRGEYELRVVANHGTYRNVGVIGNTGNDQRTHTPGNMRSVAIDADGAVYTANDWEEAGADFKKWDRSGRSVYDAEFQVRNGDPNGLPYAIAVDDRYIYCAMGGVPKAPFNARQQVQRFRSSDGKHEMFTEVPLPSGHIELYEWPEKRIPPGTSEADVAVLKSPLRALAVSGETLYVCDVLEGKVHTFHKVTGRKLGAFRVPFPTALAIAADGRLWVGHEHSKVTVFGPDGSRAVAMLSGLGDVRALAFGPDGRLYVADGGTAQVRIYDVTLQPPVLVRTFGEKARPGDSAPDRFVELQGVAVDRSGEMVTIQTLPVAGARLARWSLEGTLLWEQRGLEFVSLGTYARDAPDEFISLGFNRYRLDRQRNPSAEFRGNLFAGNLKYYAGIHGVPRIVKLGSTDFFYTAQGDGMQVFRRDGNALRPAAMVGGNWPTPEGKRDEKGPLGQWTWHDTNGDNAVGPAEILWFKRPGAGKYVVYGMNVDERGNVLFCEHDTRAIWEMPLLGLDARGNPRYEWAKARIVVPPDRSRARLMPLMAVRGPEGRLYAFGRSETWKEPKNLGAWMGGWAVSGYDARGQMLWAAPLPEVCVGMDAVPGGGVVLGWYEKAHIFHYNADGLLIGKAQPGPACGGTTGWLDNTAAVAANRDPRDHLIDVFTSDNFLYRILWYRIDDRDLEMIKAKIVL